MNKKRTEEKAYAKINLALSIKGKSNDKHMLDSIVTNVDIYDSVIIQKRKDNKINVAYENTSAEIKNDSSIRMAELLQKEYKTSGIDIKIYKNIPIASGLGGSSADAAAVARCMKKLFSISNISHQLLLRIGSDTPYMYENGNRRIEGLGEKITKISLPKFRYAILVCPGGVITKEAYELYDRIGGENCDINSLLQKINNDEPFELHNALTKAATELNPSIKNGFEFLKKAGFHHTVMTGSGSSVVGIEKEEQKFITYAKKLQEIKPKNYKLYLS